MDELLMTLTTVCDVCRRLIRRELRGARAASLSLSFFLFLARGRNQLRPTMRDKVRIREDTKLQLNVTREYQRARVYSLCPPLTVCNKYNARSCGR